MSSLIAGRAARDRCPHWPGFCRQADQPQPIRARCCAAAGRKGGERGGADLSGSLFFCEGIYVCMYICMCVEKEHYL